MHDVKHSHLILIKISYLRLLKAVQFFFLFGSFICLMHLFSPSASLCYFVSCPSSSPPSSFFRPSITKEAASVCHAAYQVSQHSGYANMLLVLTQTVCVPCLLGLADKEWCPFSSPRTCLAFVSLKAPAPILEPRFHINGCIPCPYADVLPLMVHKLIKKKKKSSTEMLFCFLGAAEIWI